MAFSDRLLDLLNENKITAKQLTDDLHLAKNSVTYWKQNGNIPKPKTLKAIAEYFGCSVEYLLGSENKKEPTIQDEQSPYQQAIEIMDSLPPDELRQLLLKLAEKLNSNNEPQD